MPVSTKEYRKKQKDTQNIWPAPDRNTPEGVRTQTGGYACDILSTGVLRSHVHIFLVDSTLVRGIFYDHSVLTFSYPMLNQVSDYISLDNRRVCGMFTVFPMSLSFSMLIIRC